MLTLSVSSRRGMTCLLFLLSFAMTQAQDFFTKPTPLRTPPPELPADVRQARLKGVVIVELTIDVTGKVAEAKVVKENEPRLVPIALKAVKKWLFRPAMKNGAKVECQISVPIHFDPES